MKVNQGSNITNIDNFSFQQLYIWTKPTRLKATTYVSSTSEYKLEILLSIITSKYYNKSLMIYGKIGTEKL